MISVFKGSMGCIDIATDDLSEFYSNPKHYGKILNESNCDNFDYILERKTGNFIFYHYTSNDNLQSILTHGFICKDNENTNFGHGLYIYLEDDLDITKVSNMFDRGYVLLKCHYSGTLFTCIEDLPNDCAQGISIIVDTENDATVDMVLYDYESFIKHLNKNKE